MSLYSGGSTSPSDALAENVAAPLAYALGWVTGIIFLFIDERPFVKFHAAQSIVVFGGLTVLLIIGGFIDGFIGGLLGDAAKGPVMLFRVSLDLVGFVLWILLMFKAHRHELFKLPIAAGIAESIAGK